MHDGNGRTTNFVIISGTGGLPTGGTMPPHLATTGWVRHERKTARSAFKDVRREMKRLLRKVTEKRVHDTRVAMRRWMSIWRVLREDDWETTKCRKRIIKPLKRLQKLLGELRDIDVNIEQGKRLECSEKLQQLWSTRRRQLQSEIEDYLNNHDILGILKDLRKYIDRRARLVESRLPQAKSSQSAFNHLEMYLLHQESVVREEAESAQSPEELHQLRLSIKRWRYLLTEFFGVTNLQLVRAQQLLGQLHDLDRLTPVLVQDDAERMALLKLKERRKQLLDEIEEMRPKLPYGLRPEVTSAKALTPVVLD